MLRRPSWHRSSAEPVLGTRLSLQVLCTQPRHAEALSKQLQAEIERLENIFSVYRPHSTLSRWKDPDSVHTLRFRDHPELCEVLALAEHWRTVTEGCFTPLADEFTALWRNAEARQVLPTTDQLETMAQNLVAPRYLVDASTGNVTKTGDCSALSLHAIAKGWIVDRAAELCIADDRVSAILVNIGGDLRLCGSEDVATSTVAIENPLRAYDNEPPLRSIVLRTAGLATSGGSRRGFSILGNWYSHVIDPRTGYPVDHVASASVFAPTAATADALATMLSVANPAEGLSFIATLNAQGSFPNDCSRFVPSPDTTRLVPSPDTFGCLIVDNDGQVFSNDAFDAATIYL